MTRGRGRQPVFVRGPGPLGSTPDLGRARCRAAATGRSGGPRVERRRASDLLRGCRFHQERQLRMGRRPWRPAAGREEDRGAGGRRGRQSGCRYQGGAWIRVSLVGSGAGRAFGVDGRPRGGRQQAMVRGRGRGRIGDGIDGDRLDSAPDQAGLARQGCDAALRVSRLAGIHRGRNGHVPLGGVRDRDFAGRPSTTKEATISPSCRSR